MNCSDKGCSKRFYDDSKSKVEEKAKETTDKKEAVETKTEKIEEAEEEKELEVVDLEKEDK